MNDLVFITLVVTGATVAFLHAAIPTHWLPFVIAARAQHWKKPKTLAVTGVAGAGHVLFTIALGVLVVWGGMAINSRMGKAFINCRWRAHCARAFLCCAADQGHGPQSFIRKSFTLQA